MNTLSIQEQYDKMLQERDALHQEVVELEKAEPLNVAAQKILNFLDSQQEPLLNPQANTWANSSGKGAFSCFG
eukprot:UN00197